MGGEKPLAAVGPKEEVGLAERVGVVDGSPVVVAVWGILGEVPIVPVPVPDAEMPVG